MERSEPDEAACAPLLVEVQEAAGCLQKFLLQNRNFLNTLFTRQPNAA